MLALLASCSGPEKLDPRGYLEWIGASENGLKKEKEFDEVTIGLLYQPAEYQALKERWNGTASDLDTSNWSLRVGGLNEQLNFHFRIKSNSQVHPLELEGDRDPYFDRLQYYLTSAQRDFILVVDQQDTLECKLYHYERNYGTAPIMDMQVTFERPAQWGEELQFIYNDPLLGIGKINFTYSQDEITTIPTLAL